MMLAWMLWALTLPTNLHGDVTRRYSSGCAKQFHLLFLVVVWVVLVVARALRWAVYRGTNPVFNVVAAFAVCVFCLGPYHPSFNKLDARQVHGGVLSA